MAVHSECKKDVNIPCLSESVFERKQSQLITTKSKLEETQEELKRVYGYLKDTEDRLKDMQIKRNQEKAAGDAAVAAAKKEMNDMGKQVLVVLKSNEKMEDETRELRNEIRILNYQMSELRAKYGEADPEDQDAANPSDE